MACIFYNESSKVFQLKTKNSEYQMKIDEIGLLIHLYYGRRIFGNDMSYRILEVDRGFSGNFYEKRYERGHSIDTLPQEFSSCGVGDYRLSSLNVICSDGSRSCDLRYESHRIEKGKKKIPGLPSVRQCDDEVETLVICLCDKIIGLCIELHYSVFPEKDIICRHTSFINKSENLICLNKAASVMLDLAFGNWDEVHFAGKHCMERQFVRNKIEQEIKVISSKRGMTSHQENPFLIICDSDANETYGDCYGIMLMYSGNHKMEIEMDQVGSTRIVAGINDENFSWNLKGGDTFYSPEVIMTYSAFGFETLSHNYHNIIRKNVCERRFLKMRRPILINNWEATYFDFNSEKIIEIAREAKKLGIEMMVLDDGWFGKRNDDNSGLGDWIVNEKKLEGGLKIISDEINKMGMKFGLWFEPEMVNEDSDLYRKHPDWVLADPNRNPVFSRNQLVLDMSNKLVEDYLFDSISKILDGANISYIKWDFNRSLANVYSSVMDWTGQGEIGHRFVLGTYSLLERILGRYPDLIIEGCSGGGGRFDAGMMYYCPQIWCSDNTDAIERLEIQEGTSFGYPVSVVGSHVSASPNHQTGRSCSLETRGIVAMAGTFGYELDITKMTDEEKSEIKKQIDKYKKYYDLIQDGLYYRINERGQEDVYKVWEFVAKDKSEALVNIVVKKSQANAKIKRIKLRGLEENAIYVLEGSELRVSGAALMYGGYTMNFSNGDYPGRQLHFIKCERKTHHS